MKLGLRLVHAGFSHSAVCFSEVTRACSAILDAACVRPICEQLIWRKSGRITRRLFFDGSNGLPERFRVAFRNLSEDLKSSDSCQLRVRKFLILYHNWDFVANCNMVAR